MVRQLTVTVPDAVTSHFVIATAHPPRDPVALVRKRLTGEPSDVLARLADDLLDTPLLDIRTDRAAWSDFGADMVAAVEPDTAAAIRLDRATHHLVVAGHAPPLAQPEQAQAARLVARVLSGASDGLVYDARCGRALPPEFDAGPEPIPFRLADHWLSAFVTRDPASRPGGHGAATGRAPVTEQDAPGTARLGSIHVETAGLHRFGLPDLALTDTTRSGWRHPLNLLRGLAVRLLADHWDWLRRHPGDSRRTIGGRLLVEAGDVWGFWASPPPHGHDDRVLVELARAPGECPGAPPFLEVGPPREFPGDRQEWLETVVAPAIPEVIRWHGGAAA
jgi:hypothetical protein